MCKCLGVIGLLSSKENKSIKWQKWFMKAIY